MKYNTYFVSKELASRIEKFVDTLPLFKYITKECQFFVYGGFMRWIQTFYLDNNQLPTTQEGLDYLKAHDIDFEFRGEDSMSAMNKLHKAVNDCGGVMEYMGDTYDGNYGIPYDGERESGDEFSWSNGSYRIWIPRSLFIASTKCTDSSTKSWIFYDFWVQSSRAHTTTADFYFNTGKYCINESGDVSIRFAEDQVIKNREMTLIPCVMNWSWHHAALRLFRWKKMLKAGFKTSKQCVKNAEIILKTIEERACEDYGNFMEEYNRREDALDSHIRYYKYQKTDGEWKCMKTLNDESRRWAEKCFRRSLKLVTFLKDLRIKFPEMNDQYPFVNMHIGDKTVPSTVPSTERVKNSKHKLTGVTLAMCRAVVADIRADYEKTAKNKTWADIVSG